MGIVKNRKIFYMISGALFAVSIAAWLFWGLKLGIDFTGGSAMEVEFVSQRPPLDTISKAFYDAGIGSVAVQGMGEKGILARFRDISQTEHEILLKKLSQNSTLPETVLVEKRFSSIGPAIGKELKQSSYRALALVLLFIMLYIAWAFRRVSRPISSWKYGVIAIAALLHDVFIPVGFFAFLGHFLGAEVDILFITALLTILGFSVHDTIVVFDRIREKLSRQKKHADFEEVVGASVSETITRSINTSLSTVIALTAVFFLGGETTKYFSLLLIVGIIAGTYSSICIASPLLVSLEKFQRK